MMEDMATPQPEHGNSEILSILGEMNTKLQKLDIIESEVVDIKLKLARLEAKVDEIDKVVVRVNAMEHSVTYLSDCFDSWKTEKAEMQNELAGVKQKVEHFTPVIESLQLENIKLREAAVDARCRSMHDNLIFTDIPVVEPIPSLVECEKVLKSFIENKLKIDPTNIGSKRVHRIGRPGSNPNRPRSMIGKCVYTEQRDAVRNASRILKGTPFKIFEQFPPEIAEYRKEILMPRLREAKAKHMKAHINIDRLIVNNVVQQVPPPHYRLQPRRQTQPRC
jgi:hypothetical protein